MNNLSFRRRLKLACKDLARRKLTWPELQSTLLDLGLAVASLNEFMYVINEKGAKSTGRQFLRLAKAARKQNKMVFLIDIASYAAKGLPLNTVPFYPHRTPPSSFFNKIVEIRNHNNGLLFSFLFKTKQLK